MPGKKKSNLELTPTLFAPCLLSFGHLSSDPGQPSSWVSLTAPPCSVPSVVAGHSGPEYEALSPVMAWYWTASSIRGEGNPEWHPLPPVCYSQLLWVLVGCWWIESELGLLSLF